MPSPSRHDPNLLVLLRSVSRSFYLSIRVLPARLRQPIAVAYLLARATDTIADTAQLEAGRRQDMLRMLAQAIDGSGSLGGVASLARTFAPLQHDTGERELIEALPHCLSWMDALGDADCADVRTVLRHITRGQLLDVQRFCGDSTVQALVTAAQLDEYTYLVAGSVGEFWTALCFRHLPGFARLPQQEMRELGRNYGMALQLVNIIRDAGADLAIGRCYFPRDELVVAGLEPQDILLSPERFGAVRNAWIARAQAGLEGGMRYADAVNNRRVRAASALPALLGARTLELLRDAGPAAARGKVKVPRREVRSMVLRLAFSLAGRATLQAEFARIARARTGREWENPGT